MVQKSKVALIATALSITAVAAFTLLDQEPDLVAKQMLALEDQSALCIHQIARDRESRNQCDVMMTLSHQIFADGPSAWGRTLVDSGKINASNIHVVERSLLTYHNALLLVIADKMSGRRSQDVSI